MVRRRKTNGMRREILERFFIALRNMNKNICTDPRGKSKHSRAEREKAAEKGRRPPPEIIRTFLYLFLPRVLVSSATCDKEWALEDRVYRIRVRGTHLRLFIARRDIEKEITYTLSMVWKAR